MVSGPSPTLPSDAAYANSRATMSKTYRKLVLERFGNDLASQYRIVETPLLPPGPGELLIRNHFAGVNALFDVMSGRNKVGYLKLTAPMDVGIEAVGVVAAVGADVAGFKEGDAVATTRLGYGYREYHTAPAANAYRIDAPLPEILALIPTGISGLVALEQVAELKDGETLAISAAAGGLGHLIVQLAKQRGCTVIGVCGGAHKVAAVQALGADRVIDYKAEDLSGILAAEFPRGLDVAYDTVGGDIFDAFLENLAVKGRLVVSGFANEITGEPDIAARERPYAKLYWKAASVRGFMNALYPEHQRPAGERLIDMHRNGALKIWVDPTPFNGLEQITQAQAHLLNGKNIGKVVLDLR
jgi:NADPH-dependent curcumin reductase CurA